MIDEELSDELLQGSCVNDIFMYDPKTNAWRQCEVDSASFGPRYNCMVCSGGDGQLFLYGGIWEVGDRLFNLDDLIQVNIAEATPLLTPINALSPDLEGCWKLDPPSSPSSSGDDDGSDTDGPPRRSEGHGSADEGSEWGGSESNIQVEKAATVDVLSPARYASLKGYFDQNGRPPLPSIFYP